MFPVIKAGKAVMHKNNVQPNLIIIFVILFSCQQCASSILTPSAFPKKGKQPKML
jgi:hypothetical protein